MKINEISIHDMIEDIPKAKVNWNRKKRTEVLAEVIKLRDLEKISQEKAALAWVELFFDMRKVNCFNCKEFITDDYIERESKGKYYHFCNNGLCEELWLDKQRKAPKTRKEWLANRR